MQIDERHIIRELHREFVTICQAHKVDLNPSVIVLFDSNTRWGQFDHMARTISISRRLAYEQAWHFVVGVLKHEMAHQYVFENSPHIYHAEGPHGAAFQSACLRLGLPAQFAKASFSFQTTNLDWRNDQRDDAAEKILDKTRKLLALANSTNEHEAQLAMERVREIYARYNLEEQPGRVGADSFRHLVILTDKKRLSSWEHRTLSILIEHFYVRAITYQQYDVKTKKHVQAIELIGTDANLLMAEHVYYFLLDQVEFLLKKTMKNKINLRGSEKRSYRLGVLDGFSRKLEQSAVVSSERPSTDRSLVQKALAQFNENPEIENYMRHIHPRLRNRSSSSTGVDRRAFTEGHKDGQSIQIRKPLTHQTVNKGNLLR